MVALSLRRLGHRHIPGFPGVAGESGGAGGGKRVGAWTRARLWV